jgi:transposase InsO family protein
MSTERTATINALTALLRVTDLGIGARVYVAFIVEPFSPRILAWQTSNSKAIYLVLALLRMAIWHRDHEDR